MIWKMALALAMAGMIVASFLTPAPQPAIGEASRTFYYHVPMAWVCSLAFAMAMVYSILYLRTRELSFDDRAHEAARLGMIFCLLATISGSIFAKVTWGSFWNWDPRETSIFVLLLIYGAYFSLRGAIPDERKRAALASVYATFAFVPALMLIFVVPRVFPSLHPSNSIVERASLAMSTSVAVIFGSSLALFTILFLWLFNLAIRVRALRRAALEA